MTPDAQTAAGAAERVQAFLDARPQDDRQGSHIVYTVPDPDRTRGRWLHLAEPDLRALLADRAQMAAELEQVRGDLAASRADFTALAELGAETGAKLAQATELVELLRRARATLHLERDEAREQFRGHQLEWAVLHISGRDGPLSEADARRFAARAAPAGARLQNRAVGEWRDVSAASAAPGAAGDTLAAERRADGRRDLTKLEGPQRGSQGRDAEPTP